MTKIVICDDEELYLESVSNLINDRFDTEIYKYKDSKALIDDFSSKKLKGDIYIIDIEMPAIDGMELAKLIRNSDKDAILIFLTNHDKYVFDAYEVNAFRYIQKSRTSEKLPEAIKVAIDYIDKINKEKYIVIGGERTANSRIKCNSIISIEKMQKYVEFKLDDNTSIRDRSTLSDVLKRLDGKQFVEIKKGIIINIEHIKIFDKLKLVMDNGTVQYISRDKLKTVKEKIMRYWGE